MEIQVPLVRGDAAGQDSQWNDSLPQNMYTVSKPILGVPGFVTAYPGLEVAGVGDLDFVGPDRGAIWVSTPEFLGQYRVVGGALIKYTKDPLVTLSIQSSIGTVPGSGLVRMAYSFNNLAIVAEGRLFYYNPTDGFREITDSEVGSPIDIVWGDNLFILTDGINIYHSNPLDEEDYLPLDFGTADFSPDPSLGLGWNEDSELIVFGTISLEHLTNVGAENFVFRRIKQKAQKIGIVSTVSKGYYGNTYYMLGGRENSQFGVYITESGASQKVSSIAVDKILNGYTRLELQNSIVEVIELDGTILCLIHLPDLVLCFNQSGSKLLGPDDSWSTLVSSDGVDTNTNLSHRAYNYVHDKQLNGWYVGDKQDFIIGRLDVNRGDQYSHSQEFIIDSPLLKLETMSIDNMEIETVPGVGSKPPFFNPTGDPEPVSTVFISRTEDGRIYGKEWSKLYGVHDSYGERFYVNRLGYVRNYTGFRLRGYSKTRMSFANFRLRVS